MKDCVIGIIGGGIGGLTTALALDQAGFNYQVFERAPAIAPVGAGIWLAPNALQMLESLRVLSEIEQAGHSIDRITVGRADLSAILDHDQGFIKDHFGYSSIAIHRAKLLDILYSQIPAERISLGKSIDSFEEDASGKIYP